MAKYVRITIGRYLIVDDSDMIEVEANDTKEARFIADKLGYNNATICKIPAMIGYLSKNDWRYDLIMGK